MAKDMKELINQFKGDEETRSESQRIMRDVVSLVESTTYFTANDKVSKYVSALGMAISASAVAKSAFRLFKKNVVDDPEYTIKISESDAVFSVAEDWLMSAMPEEKQLSVFAHSDVNRSSNRRRRRSAIDELELSLNGESEDHVDLSISFDGTIAQKVEVQDHTVEIFTSVPESAGKISASSKQQVSSSQTINFVCKTLEARNAVLDELEERSQELVQRQPNFFISRGWGGFRRKSDVPMRSADSVILKEGQMDRILGHIHDFLENESAYNKVGIPYRMGLLLHGNPGSGKSSTATAIANELGMNVFFISLSSLEDDDALANSLSEVAPRSIVVLEDIDVATKSVRDRKKEEQSAKGVTMSGMLNVLDGFVSPHGVITIMTTNALDVLDPAIIRPGRVDVREELSDLDNDQLIGLCNYFLGFVPERLPEITVDDEISSAEIVGVFKEHIKDFSKSVPDLLDLVERKTNKLYKIA